jgi:hypothetical protein
VDERREQTIRWNRVREASPTVIEGLKSQLKILLSDVQSFVRDVGNCLLTVGMHTAVFASAATSVAAVIVFV